MEIENAFSENKENEEIEEEEINEKKINDEEENNEKKIKKAENPKKFSKVKKNNLIYYFKYPELILLYYKFLKISIRIDEQTPLKNYLAEIYVILL